MKTGSFTLNRGKTTNLTLGAGFLFLKNEGMEYEGFYNIPYWFSNISCLGGYLENAINITKNPSSMTVSFVIKDSYTNSDSIPLQYFFIG